MTKLNKMLKTTHEECLGTHSFYSYFTNKPIIVTSVDKKESQIIIDYDKDHNIVGVEVFWDD